jgi:hypothetical protein
MSASFWVIPEDASETSPLAILKEQASALTAATRGQLRADVTTRVSIVGLRLTLYISVPALDDYTVELLTYEQPIQMYPGTLESAFPQDTKHIKDEREFVATLKACLSSTETQRVVSALLAQAKRA